MKHTHTISTIALAVALSFSLTLGGCDKKDDKGTNASHKTSSKIVAKTAGKIVQVKKRKVSDAQAQQALTALSLNESGSGILEWGTRSGREGNYTYNDVKITADADNIITVSSMELMGAHMEGEEPSFDKVILNGFQAKEDGGDNVNVDIKKLSLSEPSPALSGAIAASFGGDENAFDDISGDVKFGGFSLADFKLKAGDGGFNIDAVDFGKAKDKTGVFTLSNFDLDIQDGEDVKMRIGSVSATGLNLEKYEGIMSKMMQNDEDEAMQDIMSSLNPYDPDFENISIKDVSFGADGMVGSLESYVGNVVKKGDRIIMKQSMSPLTLKPPVEAKGKAKEFAEALSTMGYSELSLTMQGTTELNAAEDTMKTYDTFVEMKDGFKLSYDVDVTGYKAMLEPMKANDIMAAMTYMDGMKIGKLNMAFRDDSIIDRGFKLAASQQGGTADELRSQAKMGLAFLPMMAKDEGQQKIAKQLSEALSELLDNGGTLTLDMQPEGGELDLGSVMSGAMQGGNVDVSKFDITISHK